MIIKKTLFLCKKTILINTLTLFLVFLLLGLSKAEIVANEYYINNADRLEQEFYFVGSDESEEKAGEIKKQIVNLDDKSLEGWYINENYQNNFIKVEKGRKLDYQNTSEVLLCGEKLEKQYAIHDKVQIGDKTYTVVGAVDKSIGLVDLSFDYQPRDYVSWVDNLVDLREKEMFLTNDAYFSDDLIEGMSKISVVNTGEGISFKEISETTRKEIQKRAHFNQALIIVLYCFSLFCIISNKITEKVVLGEYYSIYHLCGYRRWNCIGLSLFINVLQVLIALLLYSCFFVSVINAHTKYEIGSTQNTCCFLAIFVIVISLMLDIRKKV